MAVLSDASIREFRDLDTLRISPFHDDALQPASYDMRLHWKLLIGPTRYTKGKIIDLRREPDKKFAVPSGHFAAVLTEETFHMPLTLVGRFGLRSEFTRQGLVAFPGIQIDPGFKGRLAISLVNAGPEPIDLKCGAKMFTVEFHTLETPATVGYDGAYQNQDDFPPDQEEFILQAHSVSLSEIQSFPRELASLEVRLARHESSHRLEKPTLTAAEIARAQGVEPLLDLNVFAGAWPEEEDISEFRAAVRNWRGR